MNWLIGKPLCVNIYFSAHAPKHWQCVNLTKLNVSHNQLNMIPAEISACTRLVTLVANNNKLISFPAPWDCPLVCIYSKPVTCWHPYSLLALWVKFSADDILKYFSNFSQKTGFYISCKLSPLETVCMKCLILFFRKNKKNKKFHQCVIGWFSPDW